jgi:hypothetical protein
VRHPEISGERQSDRTREYVCVGGVEREREEGRDEGRDRATEGGKEGGERQGNPILFLFGPPCL